MSVPAKPDPTCVPYRRKGLYFALTLPFLVLLLLVLIYLGTVHLGLALAFLAGYATMCWFQAYCCVIEECPYVGGFCPAVVGIWPANLLARRLRAREVDRSRPAFQRYALLAIAGWAVLIFLPLWWLGQWSVWVPVAYVAAHAIYSLAFGLTVCPECAIRDICPGGKLQRAMLRRGER